MSIFSPLNHAIGTPGIQKGGANGSVLFDTTSTSLTSAALTVVSTPVVIKAYGLGVGQSLAINNVFSAAHVTSPYQREGAAVVLTQAGNTEVLYLAGTYQLVFTGVLGSLIVTATPLDSPRTIGDGGNSTSLLQSELALANPLLVGTSVLSTKVQVTTLPRVFRAYGLTGSQVVNVLNVFSYQGVDTATPFISSGIAKQLSAANNTIVLDLAGYYQFQVSSPLSNLLLIGHETVAQFIDPYTLVEAQTAAAQAAASAVIAAQQAAIATAAGSRGYFNYYQNTPSNNWIVNHGLNRYPSVTVIDSSGNQVEVSYAYINSNTVQISPSNAMTGAAFLN